MKLSSRLFLALSIAPLVFAQTKYQTDLLARNPLGFWPLNGNPNDATSNGNNGSPQNGAFFSSLFTSPVEPQALVLTGAKDQFISMPVAGSSIFNLGNLHAVTAIAWVKTVSQGDSFVCIICKVDAATTGWAFGTEGSGRLSFAFVVSNNATLIVEAPNAMSDGNWHMVAATYDGSGKASGVKLYIDGRVVLSPSVDEDSIASGSILNSAPLTIGAASPYQFDGNISGAAVFGVALTPGQIQQLAEDAFSAKAILGQFAFGGGWYSAIYFANTGPDEVSFPVSFTRDSGNPLQVPSIGGSSKTITLAPGGSTAIEAPNAGILMQGYVTASLPPGVTGYAVFRQSVAGIPDQEAVVPLVPLGSQNTPLVYDETNNLITAVSIVNTSGLVVTVAVSIINASGTEIGTSSVLLQPFSKTAVALRSLPGLSQIVGTRGIARFTVSTGDIVILGLRFNGAAFTSIPAQSQSQIIKFIGTP
ncbi:MAG: LamG domain-containing protein [Acidobacteriia bacterium]|nr:LamG domain-containing protein [Terriglobia bacterium]